MSRLKLFIPVLIFAVMAAFLWRGLSNDPSHLPSALIDKPVPEFAVPNLLASDQQVTRADIVGAPLLINVWATWCAPCRAEHPYLNILAQKGVNIVGLNYKDEVADAQDWIDHFGNPYSTIIVDTDGRLGLDFGVYGAPETYFVDAEGIIRYKHVGVVDERVWRSKLAPLFAQYGNSEAKVAN